MSGFADEYGNEEAVDDYDDEQPDGDEDDDYVEPIKPIVQAAQPPKKEKLERRYDRCIRFMKNVTRLNNDGTIQNDFRLQCLDYALTKKVTIAVPKK